MAACTSGTMRASCCARCGLCASAVGLMVVCALTAFLPVLADTVPAPGAVDSRIRVAPYLPDEVYRLQGFVGYQIDLEFAPDETFVGLGAGDLRSLTFAAEANHLFLKPRAPAVDTNLTVLTSRRAYHFDYTASAHRPQPGEADVIYALRFAYPPENAAASRAVEAIDQRLARGSPAPRNLAYGYCGSPTLKPIAASDDGIETHLVFAARQELPAIFLANDDGSESLVNSTVEGAEVIVHRVARQLILRRGRLAGCVVNQAFSGGGARTGSGTVTPAVERITRRTPP